MDSKDITSLDRTSMELNRISKDEGLSEAFMKLVNIMDELREKCPWDKEQTVDTLRAMTLEEIYELTEAIDEKNWKDIKGELGDILLHLLFYARIGKELQVFSLVDVIEAISNKMIRRHPHIYGDVRVENSEDVKRNWQKIKQDKEKAAILSGVPNALPSMIKAARIQEKARQAGFDWPEGDTKAVYDKVQEEMQELLEAEKAEDPAAMEEELGDVFFSLINYARFLKLDPDKALEGCNRKFINRFNLMERLAEERGRRITDADLHFDEMNNLWNEAKQILKEKKR
ncbi:nucleoside triphosphate pyrophosphohydrolase [Arachidicoccus terrestris]|uniref:nucleoside triphosphate pyrophosphohydrolase n=1 Tax=Arachidicoccus terrestris TaxID=2875539 RepID=UPI001CC543F4|nr:nucleoside triphosphate pyrophosphohydrolase [Arachidicoccus terrestris]